jgi:hypothetical protein
MSGFLTRVGLCHLLQFVPRLRNRSLSNRRDLTLKLIAFGVVDLCVSITRQSGQRSSSARHHSDDRGLDGTPTVSRNRSM